MCGTGNFHLPHTERCIYSWLGIKIPMTRIVHCNEKTFLYKKTLRWRQWTPSPITFDRSKIELPAPYRLLFFRIWAIQWIAHHCFIYMTSIFILFSKMPSIWPICWSYGHLAALTLALLLVERCAEKKIAWVLCQRHTYVNRYRYISYIPIYPTHQSSLWTFRDLPPQALSSRREE